MLDLSRDGVRQMEMGAILSFFFFELLAGTVVFFYWLRQHSELDQARTQFAETVATHREHGTIEEYLEKVADGQVTVFKKRMQLVLYLEIFISMILGLTVVICISKFTAAGVVLRNILGIFLMIPFMAFVAKGIAEEADENRIANFERAMAKELAASIREESIGSGTPELAQEAPRS
jgi:hypothetical protein